MKHRSTKVLLTTAACGAALLFPSGARAQKADNNLALGKKVTVEPRSNYEFTKDRDPQQLTDGIYASTNAQWDVKHQTSTLWVQKGTLGWAHKQPVIITIDLGEVQPISGLIYSTAGGKSGVTWPDYIYIATSDDNETWHYAGELVELSKKNGAPPTEGYENFRYIARDLKTHGRYVALGVLEAPMIFVDEVEVLRGDDALLKQPAGREIPAMADFVAQEQIARAVRRRLNADIDSIRALLQTAAVPAAQKRDFEARLNRYAGAIADLPPVPYIVKTVLPLNDLHRDILALHGEALAAQGMGAPAVWKRPRYAWLPFVNKPDTSGAASLEFSMLRNQIRTDALLLTNAGARPLTVRIQLQNPPAGAQDGWLKLDSAIWTDTYQGVPVQDALLPLKAENGAYSLEIPAGVTGKLWATVDTSRVPAGSYRSTLVIRGAGRDVAAPLHVEVSSIAMNTPRLSLAMWDYTNGNGMYGITKENRAAAIELMRSHYVDSPWASGWVLPTPKAEEFDANNRLTTELKFTALDEWVRMWPGARRYFIFRNVKTADSFAGAAMGTPEFDARVGNWLKAIVAHWKELGLEPSQLVLCPVDEARNDDHDLHLVAWSKAFKAAVPEVQIFSDPIWRDPTQSKYPEAFTLPDILCPHPGWTPEFYQKIAREHNKELWLYNGYGLGRLGDPQLGYRQMAWRVFDFGGQGEGFWSFGDISGAPTSWNEYNAAKRTYAPAFLDEDTVYNSVHWDAARDGVTDFEELAMLRDAIGKTRNAALKQQAQKLLDGAVQAVNNNAGDNEEYLWPQATDPTVVDAQLAQVRAMLEKLQ